MDELTKKYILTRTLPNALDVEKAKKILLEHIYSISQAQNNIHLFSGSQLADMVGQQHYEFAIPTTTEPGYGDSLEKELTSLRATIAAREALTILQANGVLIPFGPIFSPAGATSNSEEIREVKVPRDHLNSDRYPVPIPAIYLEYRLATPFREDQFYRLASSEVYLSYLVQGKLSSRARRCLQECIDAYRHGLYLSAVMAVGAASESLWMQLARLIVSKKPDVTTKVQEKLRPFAPNISSIITETWQALVSQFMAELGQVFSNEIDRKLFKEQADRLCDRRNYAMHNDEADTEEQTFTYTETGMLLLESIKYFNRFTQLIEVIKVLP